jgi:hypothetical protein
MKDNKRVIVSLGTGDYNRGRERLKSSLHLNQNYAGDFYLFSEESEVGAPSHKENPYAFKIYAFELMRSKGYNQVLWVDCSVWALKTVTPVFDKITEDGYICQQAGHMVGRWTNDRTLDYFGITRDEAMEMEMYGNAGFLGLDFDQPIANHFFLLWKQSMLDGMFKGEWTNHTRTESRDERCDGHRHDMSCGSIIRHQLGMKLQSGMDYLQYVHDGEKIPHNDTVCLFAQGLRG